MSRSTPYEDVNGVLLAEKRRYEPKGFRWRSPTTDESYVWWKADGVTLYRLPHLVDARQVLVVEGEKAVDRLATLGFVATCPPTGSGVWNSDYTEALWRAGAAEVVVVRDNDRSGRDHARRVVEACHGFRPTFAEFSTEPEEPWATWPFAELEDDEVQPLRASLLGLDAIPYGGDVCDWLDLGHTADELRALIDTAPDLDAIQHEKNEHKRKLARDRQRKRRAKLRAARAETT